MDMHRPRRHGDGLPLRSSGDLEQVPPAFRNGGAAGRIAHRAELRERFAALAGGDPMLRVDGLIAGYGTVEVIHGVDLWAKGRRCA
jgi:hypothetical protein